MPQGTGKSSNNGTTDQHIIDFSEVRAQKLELLTSFHTFRNDLKIEIVRHADDRECDRSVIGVGSEIADERSIDFDGVDRKSLQISQARKASSERRRSWESSPWISEKPACDRQAWAGSDRRAAPAAVRRTRRSDHDDAAAVRSRRR